MSARKLRTEYNRLADVNARVSSAAMAISSTSKAWSRKLDIAIPAILPLALRRFPDDLREDLEEILHKISNLKRARNGMVIDTPAKCKSVSLMILKLHHDLTWHAIFKLDEAINEIGDSSNGA